MSKIKDRNFDKIVTPNLMWVTFEMGAGAQAFVRQSNFKFGKYDLKFKRAPHPDDIKFENVEVDPEKRKKNVTMSKMFILLMGIFFFFIGTYLIKEMQIVSFLRQPPLSSCERTRSIYNDEELLSLAFQEFIELRKHYNADTLDINNAISRNGALYCFC